MIKATYKWSPGIPRLNRAILLNNKRLLQFQNVHTEVIIDNSSSFTNVSNVSFGKMVVVE